MIFQRVRPGALNVFILERAGPIDLRRLQPLQQKFKILFALAGKPYNE